MSTITVPLTRDLEVFIENELAEGTSESKVHLVRYALRRIQEERALAQIREAEEDIKTGRVYRGPLRTLAKQLA